MFGANDGNNYLTSLLGGLQSVAAEVAPIYYYVRDEGWKEDWEIVKRGWDAHGGDDDGAGAVLDGLLPEESRRAYYRALNERAPHWVDEYLDETLGENWPVMLGAVGLGLFALWKLR